MYQSGVVPSIWNLGLGRVFWFFHVFIVFPQIPKVFPKFPMCSLRSSQQHFIFYPTLLGHGSISTYITCKRGRWAWAKGKLCHFPFGGGKHIQACHQPRPKMVTNKGRNINFAQPRLTTVTNKCMKENFAQPMRQCSMHKRGSKVLKIDRIMYVYIICQT